MPYALLFMALFCATALSAQTDTAFTVVTQESGPLEKQYFAGPFDFVFQRNQPVKALIKWNALALLPNITTDEYYLGAGRGTNDWRLEIAGEVAAGKRLSVNAVAAAAFSGDRESIFDYLHLGIEPRWYISRINHSPEGRNTANLSGNYVSMTTEARLNLFDNPGIQGNDRRWIQQHSLRFGVQRRLLRRGYFDINTGSGIRSENRLTVDMEGNIIANKRIWEHFLDLRIAVGWAISSPKTAKETFPACDLIQCFREEKRLIKIDLLRLLPAFDNDVKTVRLSVAYEQKIGASPWSVNTEIAVPYSRYADSGAPENRRSSSETYGAGGSIEPRYYFTLKKRIARGKTGNNLSGIFLGLNAGVRYAKTKSEEPNYFDYPVTQSNTNVRVAPVFGIQHRMFKHMYFEYKIGLGWEQWKDELQYKQGQLVRTSWNNGPAVLSELKIGLTF